MRCLFLFVDVRIDVLISLHILSNLESSLLRSIFEFIGCAARRDAQSVFRNCRDVGRTVECCCVVEIVWAIDKL